MSNVQTVFITSEVAQRLGLHPSYVIKFALKTGLNETEMRSVGNRGYLFSEEGVEKLLNARE